MSGCFLKAYLAYSELHHHFSMCTPLGMLKIIAIVGQEIVRGGEGRALIAVKKWMVAGNAFGIAGRKPEVIMFSVGVEGPGTGQGRLQQGGVPQAMQTAAYLNHRLMDCLYIGA